MNKDTSIRLTLEQRKLILQLMNYSYTIPQEYHDCVADAIKKYATTSYSDEAINKMLQKSQSVANSGFLLREDSLSFFRGKFAEWLACIEYNSLKNSGSVIMTIVNPDPTSKADLLHFIKIGDEFKAVAGPDIKTGGSTYVFDQWKKIVTSRHDIPMVDFDDILTTEDGLKQLTKNQRIEFEELCKKYPRKRPIPSAWSNQDELRIRTDYFKSILNIEGSFEYTPEIVPKLKEALANQASKRLQELDWTEFNKKCKEIFDGFDFNTDNISNTSFASEKNIIKTNKNTQAIDEKASLKGFGNKPILKPGKSAKKIAAAALIGVATVGTVLVVKNPELAKKVVGNVVKKFNNSGKTKSIADIPEKIANTTTKQMADISSKIISKASKECLRSSPILHKVSGYTRANGRYVESYMRGKNRF
jgi:hypothetical protein